MVVVSGPLFSLQARGSLGDTITYARLGRTNYSKVHFSPTNPRSDKQIRRRAMTKWLTQTWSGLSTSEKSNFERLGSAWNLSPYHAWLKFNSKRWTSNQMPAKSFPTEFFYAPAFIEFVKMQVGNQWFLSFKIMGAATLGFALRLQVLPTSDATWYDNKTRAIYGPGITSGPFINWDFVWNAPDSNPYWFRAKVGNDWGATTTDYGAT